MILGHLELRVHRPKVIKHPWGRRIFVSRGFALPGAGSMAAGAGAGAAGAGCTPCSVTLAAMHVVVFAVIAS